jgi:hypothetical protein
MEYLLVKLRIAPTFHVERGVEGCPISLTVTGSKKVRYRSASVAIRGQTGDLVSLAEREGSAEGWVAFVVGRKEEDLLLVVSGRARYKEVYLYVALEEGASVAIPAESEAIEPTDLGRERDHPAPVGETVTIESWQVTVVDVARGREARKKLRGLGLRRAFVPTGKEYVLAKMRMRYLGPDDGPVRNPGLFLKGDSPVLHTHVDRYSVFYLNCAGFYPGGQYEGWVAFEVPADEQDLIAIFEVWSGAEGSKRRYLALGR